ncbi:MAG: hypothetical protein ABI895_29640 [Deltaproteobacteria bacterium]
MASGLSAARRGAEPADHNIVPSMRWEFRRPDWTVDSTWNTGFGDAIFKFSSGTSFGPSYIDVHGKVWMK